MRRAIVVFGFLLLPVLVEGVTDSVYASPARTSNGGVSVALPAGWVHQPLSSPAGFVIGAHQSDLKSIAPKGPVFTAHAVSSKVASASSLVSLPSSFIGAVSSAKITVAGRQAVSVTYSQTTGSAVETTEFVVVALGSGLAYSFTLEAPKSQWQASLTQLKKVLASVTIDVSAVKRLT